MKQALSTVLFLLTLNTSALAVKSNPKDPCSKLGGKVNLAIRMSGAKKGEEEKLCVFYKTAILENTLLKELANEKTTALDKLAVSDFAKSKEKIRKSKIDFLGKESDAVKNCRLQGGIIFELKDYNGALDICRWEDYSGIEVNAFLRGRRVPGNKKVLSIRNLHQSHKN